jgi:hydroxypyruvate reductase
MLIRVLHEVLAACQRAADAKHATDAAWDQITPLLRGRTHLLATGKASLAMLQAALSRLPASQLGGIFITCQPELLEAAHQLTRGIARATTVRPCDHPLPSLRNVVAAQDALAFVQSCSPQDTLLVLLSGGASAHLCLPVEGISLNELIGCTRALQRSGATIRELNTVRKHVEQLKGGGLARAGTAGTLVTAILSDVLPATDGTPALDTIASGPTVPDATTFADAKAILRSRNVCDAPGILAHLERGERGEAAETPKSRDAFSARTHEIIVGDNAIMLAAAQSFLQSQGVHVTQVRERVEGEAADIARDMVRQMRQIVHTPRRSSGPQALLLGGEWTVTATGSTGLGGPSQELALAALLAMQTDDSCSLLAYSSDGIDGPTNAAGAIVSTEMLRSSSRQSLQAALDNHDAHHAFAELQALVHTGPTGTNVNHIAILIW